MANKETQTIPENENEKKRGGTLALETMTVKHNMKK
jgi:hypothetical protein